MVFIREYKITMKNILQNYFFKVRRIMQYSTLISPANDKVISVSLTDDSLDELLKISDSKLSSILEMRRNDPSWVAFLYKPNNDILGYSFLHIPDSIEWNDSLPTLPGEARISSAFVLPKFRGKGIRGLIFQQQCNYALKRNLRLWSVIESTNQSSLKAAGKTGEIRCDNYLIKFLGRNILSIVSKPFSIYLIVGERRVRR